MVNFRYMNLLFALIFVAGAGFGQDNYWYKCFTGTIDKYPFTIHLHKAEHEYSGYYYYNKTQRPIYFLGDDTTVMGKIRLMSWVQGAESENESFVLDIIGDSLLGEWNNDPEGKKGSLSVKAAIDNTLSPSFDLIYTSGIEKLRPEMEEGPTANFEAYTVWPRENSIASASLKKLINASLGFAATTADAGPQLLAARKKFLAAYVSENRNVPDSELVSYSSAYMQDVSNRIMVVYHSPSILTLGHLNYSYTGGAHGNYGTGYICINPSTGKAYSLSAVLSAAGQKKLMALLEKSFRKERKLSEKQPLTEAGLFENKIEPNNNFYVTGTGITFNYTPYEIGPYMMGEISVFIPFSEFGSGGINPSFKK